MTTDANEQFTLTVFMGPLHNSGDSTANEEKRDSKLPSLLPDLEQELQEQLDNIVPSRGYELNPVVALGGSAGSIQALQIFFQNLPPVTGMVYVVILHLSPDRHSILAELIGRNTSMRVVQAQNGEKVAVNTVYVIPPGKHMTLIGQQLHLAEMQSDTGKRYTIDLFFRSLADMYGPHSIAIVLSGADGDGAIGIKRIKERGGLTIAQDPDEAEHSSMPRSAMETGMVDWVLQSGEMPKRIVEYHEAGRKIRLPPEEDPGSDKPSALIKDEDERLFREILLFLRTRTGNDFSYYKRATIVRRIARRLQVNGLHNLSSYLSYLRTHPGESGALLQDMLISVTNFFRDRDSFEVLQEHIPNLFKGKRQSDIIRVWVPACATGEEAYSLAMLLLEHARKLEISPAIQIFGCDLDDEAIQTARAGIYPETISADVSEERLNRFFVKELRGYRVRREVREMLLFAVHDLLKDAPFSRLDFISCRNLLIYLNRDAQTRALDIFHFALRPDGYLFLGSSESVEEGNPQFKVLDKKHRIYTHRIVTRVGFPVPIGPSFLLRTIAASKPASNSPVAPDASFAHDPTLPFKQPVPISFANLHFKLIEEMAPPSVLINQEHEIMHVSEKAGDFLKVAGGEPTTNLLKIVNPGLRIELRAALFRAVETKEPVEVCGVAAEIQGARRQVDMAIRPAHDVSPGFFLVVFNIREANPAQAANPTKKQEPLEHEPVVQHLERSLEQVKEHLRDTVEQYEASNEELKASNEELQAMNEELRSATEELETSREELQSINEELTTVNHELKSKVDELGQANSLLHNLMGSTAIATLFLDREQRIMRFTPSAAPIFNLISGDLGRPLGHLQHRLIYSQLSEDAANVLANLIPVEREVRDIDGHWFLARLLPYRTVEDRIAGVVLTLVDISATKRAEEALGQSQERLRLLVENAREFAIFAMDLERRVTVWNSGAERILGYSETEILGKRGDELFVPEDRESNQPELEVAIALKEGRSGDERWHLRKDGSRFWSSGFLMTMKDGLGEVIGFVKILHDRTKAKKAEEELARSKIQLEEALTEAERARKEAESANRTKDKFLAVLSHELRTPLTPVLIAAESMLKRKDLPDSVMDALQMIQRNVELETRFINDLLDVTRISRGQFELTREPLQLNEVIKRAVEVSQPDLVQKKQKLKVELNAAQQEVLGDASRLQQVFWNLLKNASKFTEEEGSVHLRSRNEPGQIVVEISDTGIGIEQSALPNLFDPFQQADESIARKYGGFGLGLAICKAVLDVHEGTLKASSEGIGKGATFTVRLPIQTRQVSNG